MRIFIIIIIKFSLLEERERFAKFLKIAYEELKILPLHAEICNHANNNFIVVYPIISYQIIIRIFTLFQFIYEILQKQLIS